ncbi:MAG: hypothetical protein K940chlam1_00719 [Candidatus Anoxychlamydiales bacterium]|nr:hypothetical protein [Candidatus Anoxychlamydiales bacterium]NGX36580.1 hypothetical protein [Candidatus Anoxychlamydiales bacterium]
MKYKISWMVVLFLSGFIFCWFGFKTVNQINYYFVLDQASKAHIDKVKVKDLGKEKFEVLASYYYKVGEEFFFKTETFKNKFLNYDAAQTFGSKISKDISIWYNFKNPKISTMEKIFPIKNLVYSILTLIVFIYFVIMKYYIFGFQKNG